jgi:hypothetical protein
MGAHFGPPKPVRGVDRRQSARDRPFPGTRPGYSVGWYGYLEKAATRSAGAPSSRGGRVSETRSTVSLVEAALTHPRTARVIRSVLHKGNYKTF